jgi:hypothetical protein
MLPISIKISKTFSKLNLFTRAHLEHVNEHLPCCKKKIFVSWAFQKWKYTKLTINIKVGNDLLTNPLKLNKLCVHCKFKMNIV